jgi:hypothetical protein
MLFQVSSEGWSWADAADCATPDRTRPAGDTARQSVAIKAGTITLEKIDMVEFPFHHEAVANLSEPPASGKPSSICPDHSHSSSP